MAKSKLAKANQKIEKKVVDVYKTIEHTVVDGYRKFEDQFVDQYLTKDGETIEDAKKRLKAEQLEREQKHKELQALHRQKTAEKHTR